MSEDGHVAPVAMDKGNSHHFQRKKIAVAVGENGDDSNFGLILGVATAVWEKHFQIHTAMSRELARNFAIEKPMVRQLEPHCSYRVRNLQTHLFEVATQSQ